MKAQTEVQPLPQWFFEKYLSKDDPSPMKPAEQQFFQRLCAKEAERLRYFLNKALTKKARQEIIEYERCFSKAASMSVVSHGVSRSLCPYMGRALTAYRAGIVRSYRRRPKGNIYQRL